MGAIDATVAPILNLVVDFRYTHLIILSFLLFLLFQSVPNDQLTHKGYILIRKEEEKVELAQHCYFKSNTYHYTIVLQMTNAFPTRSPVYKKF